MLNKTSHRVAVIFSIVSIAFLVLIYLSIRKEASSIFSSSYQFEYGEVIDFKSKVEPHFNQEDLSFLNDLNYPEVGTYTLKLNYTYFKLKWSSNVEVIIKDSTKPKVVVKEDKHTLYIGEDFDVASLLDIDDLSEWTIEVDKTSFDTNQKGIYNVLIHVIDAYDNITTVTIPLEVLEPKPIAALPDVNKPFVEPPLSNTIKAATYRDGHVIVNKKHGLPDNFASGEDPLAKTQIVKLINEMKDEGMAVDGSYAGFRTWDHQNTLYTNYVKQHGQEAADISSAKPGYSEHQTGLTFDLRSPNGTLLQTQVEVDWVANNAHRFGFIVRYPEGKTHVTGYKYEPWHLRYMGSDAEKIYQSSLSLEEYYNIEG